MSKNKITYKKYISNFKTLKELTKDDYIKWKSQNCINCRTIDCPFKKIDCSLLDKSSWFNNKEIYSESFLNQKVELIEVEKYELKETKI